MVDFARFSKLMKRFIAPAVNFPSFGLKKSEFRSVFFFFVSAFSLNRFLFCCSLPKG